MSLDTYRSTIRNEKRQAILKASLVVFLSQGYQGAGMAEIARQADVSTATLYKHFSSKDELFGAMVEMHVEAYQVRAMSVDDLPSGDPAKCLRLLSEGFVHLLRDERTVGIFRNIIGEGDRFPVLKEMIYRRGRDPFKQMLVEYFASEVGQADLEIADNNKAAEWYIGLLSYWLIFVRVFNSDVKMNEARFEDILGESIAMFLARYRKATS